MRILLTSGIYPPDIGGPATYVPKFARYIAEKHEGVRVVSLRPSGDIEACKKFKLSLIKRRFLPFRLLNTTFVVLSESLKSDRIFSNGLYLEAGLAARILNKPAVAKIVGDPVWERARNKHKTELSMKEFQVARLSFPDYLMRKVYRFTFNSFSILTCPSQELVEIVRSWGITSPVVYVPNGVEIPEKKLLKKDYDLIFVGRLVPWKNVDLLIQLAADLNLKAVIIGGGPEAQRLKMLASLNGADCFFTGELSKPEILDFLNRAKLFVLLSQYEGLSFALLEAMAAGLPSLVSSAPGNLAVVSDNKDAIVVDVQQIPNSYSIISGLVQDSNKLTLFGENARSKVKEKYEQSLRLEDMFQLIASAK